MARVSSLRAELNCRMPATADEFMEWAHRWLETALRQLGTPLMEELEKSGPLSSAGLRDRSGLVPFGEPGSVWMSLVVGVAGGKGIRSSISAWSPKDWEKFIARLRELPVEASVKLSRLGVDGYPDVPALNVSVVRYPEQSDWMVLSCDGSTNRMAEVDDAQATRRLWVDLLRQNAARTEAAFGYLSDEADYAGPRTALEAALGLFPEETLGLLDRQLRGYSWITVAPPGVVDLLGGAEALVKSGAFREVVSLSSGSVWLRAADDLPDYDGDRQRMVFETLAKALPPGQPRRDRRAHHRRLVYEDAAEYSAGVDGR